MRIIADTNVLLRAVLGDNAEQSHTARLALSSADQVILGRHALCELVWVLSRSYKLPNHEIYKIILGLLDAENVITDMSAMEAGLKALQEGEDFADAVVAYEGRWLGGDTFISFDKSAVAFQAKQGHSSRLLV